MNLELLSEQFANFVWGLPLIFFIVGSGIIFTVYLGFPQIRFFWHSLEILSGKYDDPKDKGEITHFQALCAALSGTLGLGNIAGIAVAISIGGPGAVFWLWVSGFIAMSIKFVEVVLALTHRETGESGHVHGGPMYVIKNGLPKKFFPFAWGYAFFAIPSVLGAGNMFQSNQMSAIIKTTFNMPEWASGILIAICVGFVLIGGIKRIGKVTEKLVPGMVLLYFAGTLVIIFARYEMIPEMFMSIFSGAFAGTAALGGFVGASVKEVVIVGIRRATFSNEAGLGTASMAHSAAKSSPIQEGIVGLLEPFIDTIVVCTLTALALLLTKSWMDPKIAGSEMTALAFESVMGISGRWIVACSVVLFGFATLLTWNYYGEQGVTFIFGEKWIKVFRYVFCVFIFIGSVTKLSIVLNLSDGVYGFLAIPNMLGCYLLIPKVKKALQEYQEKRRTGEIRSFK
jgi:AGCS family alanine or glycine:cation symporter